MATTKKKEPSIKTMTVKVDGREVFGPLPGGFDFFTGKHRRHFAFIL